MTVLALSQQLTAGKYPENYLGDRNDIFFLFGFFPFLS